MHLIKAVRQLTQLRKLFVASHESFKSFLSRLLAMLRRWQDPRLKTGYCNRLLFWGRFTLFFAGFCRFLGRLRGETLAEYLLYCLVDLDPCKCVLVAEGILSLELLPSIMPTSEISDWKDFLVCSARIWWQRAHVVDRAAYLQVRIASGQSCLVNLFRRWLSDRGFCHCIEFAV